MNTVTKKFSIREARADEAGLILEFIKKLAAYEKCSDEVVADESTIYQSIFEEKAAEVVFAEEDGESTPSEPDPYEVLGCSQSATDDELRRAYREKAKQLHPDVLRAQGLSDELISRASEQMARLNAAWATLRQKRRL